MNKLLTSFEHIVNVINANNEIGTDDNMQTLVIKMQDKLLDALPNALTSQFEIVTLLDNKTYTNEDLVFYDYDRTSILFSLVEYQTAVIMSKPDFLLQIDIVRGDGLTNLEVARRLVIYLKLLVIASNEPNYTSTLLNQYTGLIEYITFESVKIDLHHDSLEDRKNELDQASIEK